MKKKLLFSLLILCSVYLLIFLISYIHDDSYFPKGAFSSKSINDERLSLFYSKILNGLNEPNLYKRSKLLGTESFRFMYAPALHKATFIIRVDFYSKESGKLFYKVYRNKEKPIEESMEINLTGNQTKEIREKINNTRFWSLKSQRNLFTIDGEIWLFEGNSGAQYHLVERAGGEDKNLEKLGTFLGEITQKKPFGEIPD
ncbi:MAG TPA: hypothetical protein VF941_18870 [Clostridia bacterium]